MKSEPQMLSLEDFGTSLAESVAKGRESTAPSGSPSGTRSAAELRSLTSSSTSVIASFSSSSSYRGSPQRSRNSRLYTTRCFGTVGEFRSMECRPFDIPAVAMSLIPLHPKISWEQLPFLRQSSRSGTYTFSGRIS